MPQEVQNGTALVHGIANDGTAIALSGYISFILETADAGHKFELDRIKDEMRATKSLVATDPYIELDVTWAPSGATRALAAASGNVYFLRPLAKVTISHFKVGTSIVDGTSPFNGDWVYVGDATIKLLQGTGKMSIKLNKWDDATQNASLTTTITG